ncbi:hypothetical protein [Actinoplanes sp. NPDC049118]|uniref:hypothetical protein n=1 Tax=Actinoplanes sp. NPDC049118 TaxID=3155769 RepID=UPI0033F84044
MAAAGAVAERRRPSERRRHSPAAVPSTRTAATTIRPVVSIRSLWHAPHRAAM